MFGSFNICKRIFQIEKHSILWLKIHYFALPLTSQVFHSRNDFPRLSLSLIHTLKCPNSTLFFILFFIKNITYKHESLRPCRLVNWRGLQQMFVFLDNQNHLRIKESIKCESFDTSTHLLFPIIFPTKFLFLSFYF